jgi:hypothetical protein
VRVSKPKSTQTQYFSRPKVPEVTSVEEWKDEELEQVEQPRPRSVQIFVAVIFLISY